MTTLSTTSGSTTSGKATAAQPARVHLCCGHQRFPGWINVDLVDFGQEIVADLSQRWTFLEDGSVQQIFCKDGFEHQPDIQHFLRESSRVLIPGGTLEIWVPHFKNPSAYRITHHHYFSWSEFNIYPEPHDDVQDLKVVSNRLYVGWPQSTLWRPIHALINTVPKWWERLAYVSNLQIVFQKRA